MNHFAAVLAVLSLTSFVGCGGDAAIDSIDSEPADPVSDYPTTNDDGVADDDEVDVAAIAKGWSDAYEKLNSGKADNSCNGLVVPDRNFKKKVALTFDDGANASTTVPVVEILDKYNVKGTFFMLGNKIMKYRTLTKRMAAKGHLIGNHSENHLDLARVDMTTFQSEFLTPEVHLNKLGLHAKFFRFPYGNATCDQLAYLRSKKTQYVGWNVDSADWCYAAGGGVCTKEMFKWIGDAYRDGDMAGNVLAQLKQSNGGIVLFHDVFKFTAAHLEEVILAIKGAGYTFVRLDDKGVFPKLNAY